MKSFTTKSLVFIYLLLQSYSAFTIESNFSKNNSSRIMRKSKSSTTAVTKKTLAKTTYNKDILYKTRDISLSYSYWLFYSASNIKKKDPSYADIQEIHIKDVYLIWGVLKDSNYMVICFRGSFNLDNFIRDGDFKLKDMTGYKVHNGFQAGYELVKETLRTQIAEKLNSNTNIKNIGFTGHSLGAALTTIALLDISEMINADAKLKARAFNYDLVTYGGPRIGDAAFAKKIHDIPGLKYNMRIIKGQDLVTQIPGDPYVHAGTSVIFDTCHENPVSVNEKHKDEEPKSAGNIQQTDNRNSKVIELIKGFFSKEHKEEEFSTEKRTCGKLWDHLWYFITKDEFASIVKAYDDKLGNPYV